MRAANLNQLQHNMSLISVVTILLVLAFPKPGFAKAQVDEPAHSAALLSAFFGLDNALPFRANLLCLGAAGKDGMPVVLSQTINPETLEAEDFLVVTESGAKLVPDCVTLRPAQDPGELRTVLLIGQFGNANDDPPATVQVVGDLLSDETGSSAGEPVNFRGSQTAVTPLHAGPSLVLAKRIPLTKLTTDTRGTTCPQGIQQVVRVTWAGGVRLPNGDEPGDAERKLYRITVNSDEDSNQEVIPAALADLNDADNNHLLCLDTANPAIRVSFPGGHLVDPNQDLNPDTQITVSLGVN